MDKGMRTLKADMLAPNRSPTSPAFGKTVNSVARPQQGSAGGFHAGGGNNDYGRQVSFEAASIAKNHRRSQQR